MTRDPIARTGFYRGRMALTNTKNRDSDKMLLVLNNLGKQLIKAVPVAFFANGTYRCNAVLAFM